MDDIFKIIPSLLTIIVTTERVTNHNNQWIPPSLQKDINTFSASIYKKAVRPGQTIVLHISGEDDFSCNGQPRLYQENIRTAIHYW